MDIDQTALNLIATSLSKHFDSMHFVDLETGEFQEFVHSERFEKLNIPKQGKDFFEKSTLDAEKFVHPDDLKLVLFIHDKNTIREYLSKVNHYSIIFRLIIDGRILHVRHVIIMCEDKKHIICCMENIEAEFQVKNEQEKNLQSAERMARLDELTGIKNKNAFAEFTETFDRRIKSGKQNFNFGIVICDVNDLKKINDTRGHSFGDEAIQRTSRLICDIFKRSPVFRIGGDEFAVLLTDSDYDNRDNLLKKLHEESQYNKRTRSGPEIASGLTVFNPETDKDFSTVFKRADKAMYENKNELKSRSLVETFRKMDSLNKTIPPERKRMLDSLFGAFITVAGESYIYLNDMNYDYSRWSLSLVDDFALDSEYMYHADKVWLEYIHPDDLDTYKDAVDAVLCGNAELKAICYRARKPDGSYVLLSTRGFVLTDINGHPDYFGGIIIPQ